MKLSESSILTVAAVIASTAGLFALIGLTTPKWLLIGRGLWNCTNVCSTSAATLAILGLFLLVISVVLLVVLIIRILPRKLRSLPLGLLVLATLFLLAATTSYLRRFNTTGYSFELIVTAHALAFLDSVLLAFWFGTTITGNTTPFTTRHVVSTPTMILPSS